jgi:carbonic anhydrase/acetyltransferase-like protein (isoleucine patch superfamily)
MDFSLHAIQPQTPAPQLDLELDAIAVQTPASQLVPRFTVASPFGASVNADWLAVSGPAQILNKPVIPTPYVLPVASATVLGGIKVGANLSIDVNGVLSAGNSYVLPIATASVLGGVKVGSGLSVDGTGLLSANVPTQPTNQIVYGAGTSITSNANFVVNSSNQVGIGTATFIGTEKLRVNGDEYLDGSLRFGGLSADPAGAAGLVYYNTTSSLYRVFNSAWTNVITGILVSGRVPFTNGVGSLTSVANFLFDNGSYPNLSLTGGTNAAIRMNANKNYSVVSLADGSFGITYDNVTGTYVIKFVPAKSETSLTQKFVLASSSVINLTTLGWNVAANNTVGAMLWNTDNLQPFIWDGTGWRYIPISSVAGALALGTTTFTASEKLRVLGNIQADGAILVGGSIDSISSTGRALYVSSTLNPASNTDILVGLDINPTYSTGTPIATFGAITGGSGYVNGTYSNVPLTISSGTTGSGATANITVSGGVVTAVTLVNGGHGYAVSGVLTATAASLGGTGSGFSIPIATLGSYTGAVKIALRTTGNVTHSSLPTFADDTAAGTGGLTSGMLYKTSTGTVMVKL